MFSCNPRMSAAVSDESCIRLIINIKSSFIQWAWLSESIPPAHAWIKTFILIKVITHNNLTGNTY